MQGNIRMAGSVVQSTTSAAGRRQVREKLREFRGPRRPASSINQERQWCVMCLRMQRMILLAAAGAGACGSGCQPVPGSAPRGSTTVNGEPSLAVQPEPAAPQTRQVSIDNFTFSPAELTVPAGSKVVLGNHHDV